MSAVTKILVVLVVVLCIAFSMVAIQFAAQSSNWKQLAEDFQRARDISDANQRNLMAAHAAQMAAARDTIKGHLDRISQLESDAADLTQQSASQQGEIAQLTADKRRADALAQRLTNELSVAQAARAEIESQRDALESRNIELERRNIDLNDRVNELTTQVTVLQQQQRKLEQELNIVRGENERIAQNAGVPALDTADLSAVGVPRGGVVAETPVSTPRIAGHVAMVDGDLVTLSVGSADNVKPGSVFVISRGSEYVGDLEITDVEPNLSAGRLIRSRPGMAPRQGDMAIDEHHFATAP